MHLHILALVGHAIATVTLVLLGMAIERKNAAKIAKATATASTLIADGTAIVNKVEEIVK